MNGLARSAAAAETLMQHEVAPVLGALETPERYREAAARADVIAHLAVDYATDTASVDEWMAVFAVPGLIEKLRYLIACINGST